MTVFDASCLSHARTHKHTRTHEVFISWNEHLCQPPYKTFNFKSTQFRNKIFMTDSNSNKICNLLGLLSKWCGQNISLNFHTFSFTELLIILILITPVPTFLHVHLVLRLWMSGTILLLPPPAFTASTGQLNFTLTFNKVRHVTYIRVHWHSGLDPGPLNFFLWKTRSYETSFHNTIWILCCKASRWDTEVIKIWLFC